MKTTLRRNDSDLDDAIRKSLGDIIASGQPGWRTSEPASDLADRYSGRRWLASGAAVVLVIAGLGLIASRNLDGPAPADRTSVTSPASPPPSSASDSVSGVGDLNPDGLNDPANTVFGGLVDPLLPDGYELVFASDDPEPLVVALNASGDRFEAAIYSSESRLAEVDRVRDELQLEVPEGLIAVGSDGQPDERNAYLVTESAIVATDYTRIADPSTIEPGSAVDIARAISRDLPPALVTGAPVGIGTGLFDAVTTAVESLAEQIDESGGNVLSTRAPTVEVIGDFASSNGIERATVRVEMFDGFLAPTFLESGIDVNGARPQVARVATWLVIVTIDGAVWEDSNAFKALAAVSGVLNGTAAPIASEPTDLTPAPRVDAAPVVLPGQLMEISPQDEFLVITAWRNRLNDCLAEKGQPADESDLDSLDDIVAYRTARDAKVAGDYDIVLPERHSAGTLSSDPTVRACADVAETSVTTSSGWALYATPQESVDAQMEVNDQVYGRLADARTDWSDCMATDFGYEGAEMSASPSVWSTAVDLTDPDEAAAVDVADERCLETIGYYDTQLQITIEETRRWADNNKAILDRLTAEAEVVLQAISSD